MPDLQDIVRRKERLISRCAQQRQTIAAALADLRAPIAVADRVLAGIAYLRAHPLLLGVGVAVIVALRRRSLTGLALRAVAAWRTLRTVRDWARQAAGLAALRGRRARQG